MNLSFGFDIAGVKAFNQNTLVVYGDYGLVPSILYSGDGGNSFTLVYHSQYNDLQLSGGITDMVFPENNSIGFASDADRVLKTIDGGQNWLMIKDDPQSFFESIEATDNNTVFVFNELPRGKPTGYLKKALTDSNIFSCIHSPFPDFQHIF